MTKAITMYIVKNEGAKRMIFRTLVLAIFILSCAYVYLIGSITFNVLAYKPLNNTNISLIHNINQLELEYMNNYNKIDKNYAISQGFVEVNHNLFATRSIPRVAIR